MKFVSFSPSSLVMTAVLCSYSWSKANNLTSTWIFYTCLCFLLKRVLENAPHTLFMMQAPHWFCCCLISAVTRYFLTSKSPSLLSQRQLSHRIACSTLELGRVQRYGGKGHLVKQQQVKLYEPWATSPMNWVWKGHCYWHLWCLQRAYVIFTLRHKNCKALITLSALCSDNSLVVRHNRTHSSSHSEHSHNSVIDHLEVV